MHVGSELKGERYAETYIKDIPVRQILTATEHAAVSTALYSFTLR